MYYELVCLKGDIYSYRDNFIDIESSTKNPISPSFSLYRWQEIGGVVHSFFVVSISWKPYPLGKCS